ncbi:cytochrome c oxidase assembly factor CtaG [Bacillus sp. H-16]|uniref:Cytochrome c oxidase assembly factor CtaG n=1 Tax=Alteribacter keqinensis TaxID=2483800 RepID=A0A3M7TYW2_9BACI|nr:cytochrome c oxidase assembly factor CtaG [Alteribacter salitolerans]RNA70643.1 cytochrome c oxidase assembly factor CtaG [Alteribacter keqinensis]
METYLSSFPAWSIWTPELIVVLLVFSALYFWVTGPLRHKFEGAEPVSTRRKVYFHIGLIAVYFGFGGPLYVLGHMMLSMHMLSMAIVYLIAPPFILLGIPSWVFKPVAKIKAVQRIFRVFGNPIIGLLLFNAMFSIYHLPFTFDRLLTNEGAHNIYQLGMLFAAGVMWWHLVPRIQTRYELSELKKIGYMFGNGVLITPACALIIFAGAPLYETYTDASTWATAMAFCLPAGTDIPYELFAGSSALPPLRPLHDQQLGGAIMKVVQELVYGVAIGTIFKQWMNRDKTDNAKEELKEYEVVQTH